MTKIDRYLLFLYLRAFCISFASLSGLLIVVLLFTNLDEFQRFAAQKDQHLFQVVSLSGLSKVSRLLPGPSAAVFDGRTAGPTPAGAVIEQG